MKNMKMTALLLTAVIAASNLPYACFAQAAASAAVAAAETEDDASVIKHKTGAYTELSWQDPDLNRIFASDWDAEKGAWTTLCFVQDSISYYSELFFRYTADDKDAAAMQALLEAHFGEGYEITVQKPDSPDDAPLQCRVINHELRTETAEKVETLLSELGKENMQLYQFAPKRSDLYYCNRPSGIGQIAAKTEDQVQTLTDWLTEHAPDWEIQQTETACNLRKKGKDFYAVDPAEYLKLNAEIRTALNLEQDMLSLTFYPETNPYDFSDVLVYAAQESDQLSDTFTTAQGVYHDTGWRDPDSGQVYYTNWDEESGKWTHLYYGDGTFYSRLRFSYTAPDADPDAMKARLTAHFGEDYEITVEPYARNADCLSCTVIDHQARNETDQKVEALYSSFSEGELREFYYSPQIGDLYDCFDVGGLGELTAEQKQTVTEWLAENAPDWELCTVGVDISYDVCGVCPKGKSQYETEPGAYLKMQYDVRKLLGLGGLWLVCIPESYAMGFRELQVYSYAHFTAADVRRSIIRYCDEYNSPLQDVTPVSPAEGNIVGRRTHLSYEGIACRCNDPGKIKPDADGGITVQSYDAYLKARNDSEHPFDADTMELQIQVPVAGVTRENLYIVNGSDPDAIMQFCAENPALEPVGFLRAVILNPEYYYGTDTQPITITPRRSGLVVYTIHPEDLDTEEYHYLKYLNGGWYPTDGETGKPVKLSLEEAAALCEKLTARTEISKAWLTGTANEVEYPENISYFQVMEVQNPVVTKGDVDGNGSVDLKDALTALQTYSKTTLMQQRCTMDHTEYAAADYNNDGVITIADALTILQIYTNETLFTQDDAQTHRFVRAGWKNGQQNIPCENEDMLSISAEKHLPVMACRSMSDFEALTAFTQENFTASQIGGSPAPEDCLKKYDEAFFEKNLLLFIYNEEPSGSIQLAYEGVQVKENGTATVTIQRYVPVSQTADMAYWICLTELPKAQYEGCTFDAVAETIEEAVPLE